MQVDGNREVLDRGGAPRLAVEGLDPGNRVVADQAAGDEPEVVLLLVVGVFSGREQDRLCVRAALGRAAVRDPLAPAGGRLALNGFLFKRSTLN